MACPDHQTLGAFVQRRLDPSRRQAVADHAAGCSACASVLRHIAPLKSLPADPHGPTMRSPSPAVGPSGTLQVEGSAALVTGGSTSMVSVSVGTPIGRYIAEDVLGEGGMGVVLRAHDPVLARTVAIKLIRPELVEKGFRRESTERFIVEARAMATLNHPNVVGVYDAGQHQSTIFIAMEYVPGQTLDAWLRRPRDPSAIVAAFVEAAAGLQAAHDAAILHRDFKPQNVLVGLDGRMRVTDFGLARSGSHRNLTAPGAVMGTPAYMAPEQLFGQAVDPRADQFSFCVTLWEALFGHRPFNGRDLDAIRWAMMNQPLERPPNRDDVPPAVVDALLRGLRIAPAERFPSLRELIAALEPQPAAPSQVGETHVKVHLAAQLVFSFLHLGLVLFTIWAVSGDGSGSGNGSASSSGDGETTWVALGLWGLAVGLFGLLGFAWAPLNAFGLWRRAAWGRLTTLIYGTCTLFTVLGLPYGVYAIWSLTQSEVRRTFKEG